MAEALTLPLLVGAAVVDSINPCAFGVLIFLCAYLLKAFKKPKQMLVHGLVYTFAVFVTYLAAGLVLMPILGAVRKWSIAFYIAIGAVIILAGLIEIKDYFFYGRWLSLTIRPSDAERIKAYTRRIGKKLSTAFGLGVFVALVELPCTGAVYLATLALMSLTGVNISNILLLLIYNLLFVLPLLVIIYLMYRGVSAKKFHQWHEHHKGLMRLVTGIVLIGLGAWMIWFILG